MRNLVIIALLVGACAPDTAIYQRDVMLAPPAWQGACVTHGAGVAGPRTIVVADPDSGASRLVEPGSVGDHAALAFTWDGDSVPPVKLSDGAVRRQACLKLRAANGCNLAYACWRVGDAVGPWVQVQVKSNPGKSTANECGANGYVKVVPTASAPPDDFRDGARHLIVAEIAPDLSLVVTVDGAEAWSGALPAVAASLTGPAGERSDNLRWHGDLYTEASCADVTGD